MKNSATNTAARELPSNDHLRLLLGEMTAQEMRTAKAAYQLAVNTLTQQQGGEHALAETQRAIIEAAERRWYQRGLADAAARDMQPAASDNLCGLRNEEGMLSGAELESLIDAAQTTTDNKAVAFLGQVARDLLQQLHGIESALLSAGKRPPLCDTENAVRFAVGMSWNANGDTK